MDRYFPAEEGLEVSGVVLPIDDELAQTINRALEDFNAGRIKQQQYRSILTKADKKHRAGRINWAQLPAADVARLFDSVMAATRSAPGAPSDPPDIPDMLRELWLTLKPEEIRELFSICCMGRWPEWIAQSVQRGGLEPNVYRRRRRILEAGLDKVAEYSQARNRRPAVTIPQPERPAIAAAPKVRLVDRTDFVDQSGLLLEFERVRRFGRARA